MHNQNQLSKSPEPDARNYAREFIEGTTDCQPCEGTGEVAHQGKTVVCPNCGGAGWQSSTSNYYEES
jgi:DnaJ-class molecular chaperone